MPPPLRIDSPIVDENTEIDFLSYPAHVSTSPHAFTPAALPFFPSQPAKFSWAQHILNFPRWEMHQPQRCADSPMECSPDSHARHFQLILSPESETEYRQLTVRNGSVREADDSLEYDIIEYIDGVDPLEEQSSRRIRSIPI